MLETMREQDQPQIPRLRASLQGKLAAAARWDSPDRENIARDYAAEQLADYITRTVAAAPPLTAEQRDRLASIFSRDAMGG